MRIAIVCDDLIQFGGQEKLVMALSDMWPNAVIHSSVISKKWQEEFNEKKRKYAVSFMQKLPFVEKLNRYYSPFFCHILAFESFNFDSFDIVLSVSARYSHFVLTKPNVKHVVYFNSPGRMFWESKEYFEHDTFSGIPLLKRLKELFLTIPLNYIRMTDFIASQRADYIVSNSKNAQKKVKKYYGRDSEAIHPFVNCAEFSGINFIEGNYYVVLTRLVSWKKVEIAIEACQRLGKVLKVIGKGPDEKRLRGLAGEGVEFFNNASDSVRIEILAGCKGLIVTQNEDFGIVPLEAMCCGKGVIAYGRGGAKETIIENQTGIFFNQQTSESLSEAIIKFESTDIKPNECVKRAKEFDKEIFAKRMQEFVLRC